MVSSFYFMRKIAYNLLFELMTVICDKFIE